VRFVLQQPDCCLGLDPVGEVRKVVEQARPLQRPGDIYAVSFEIRLRVSEEHRHRQKQSAAAGVERRLTEFDRARDG
jgi:hypothetical protein